MSAIVSAYGRLAADPRPIATRTGKPMTTARLAVSVKLQARETTDAGPGTLWLGIVCFGAPAAELARHAKGDSVSVLGRLQLSKWQGRDGGERESWECIADSVVSARSARPGARSVGGAPAQGSSDADFPF